MVVRVSRKVVKVLAPQHEWSARQRLQLLLSAGTLQISLVLCEQRSSSAVLGASNYTYTEAARTQTQPDWIAAHLGVFRFFGGVLRLVVPRQS